MNSISTFNQVKLHNVSLIRNTLRSISCATKNSVAQLTGLSIATCNTILNELLKSGEVIAIESDAPSVGRPPQLYQFNKDYSYICCLFATVESDMKYLNYAIVDLLGNIILQRILAYDLIYYEDIEKLLAELLAKEPKIQTISIGIPGYVSNGKIRSCSIEELSGCHLAELLSNKFHKTILIENNMNATAYGFYMDKASEFESIPSFVMISFFKGNGPGSGIILNGKIVHGCTNIAGEVLYLPYPDGEIHELISRGTRSVIECAAFAMTCYCALLDPALVIFTGENLSEEAMAEIRQICLHNIPEEHLPEIQYEKNYIDPYIHGLTQIAFDHLFH